jgi:hypothetical protein
MKKIKIMLLSLALIAVVGGAWAFKAFDANTYCTVPAWNDGVVFYCSYDPVGPIEPLPITTISCETELHGSLPSGVQGEPECCYTTLIQENARINNVHSKKIALYPIKIA